MEALAGWLPVGCRFAAELLPVCRLRMVTGSCLVRCMFVSALFATPRWPDYGATQPPATPDDPPSQLCGPSESPRFRTPGPRLPAGSAAARLRLHRRPRPATPRSALVTDSPPAQGPGTASVRRNCKPRGPRHYTPSPFIARAVARLRRRSWRQHNAASDSVKPVARKTCQRWPRSGGRWRRGEGRKRKAVGRGRGGAARTDGRSRAGGG